MEPEKQGGKSSFNADQLAVMDALEAHLKADKDIASFPSADGQPTLSPVLQDNCGLSRRTQDTPTFGLIDFPNGIALRAATLLQPPPPADSFANLKAFEEAAQRGWLLSSSQLAPLLGLKTLTGQFIAMASPAHAKVGTGWNRRGKSRKCSLREVLRTSF